LHGLAGSRREARTAAIDWMGRVGIPDPSARADQHPFAFSGGMRQRGVIAMGLAGNPALILADEPTTALDVTIQAQILDLLHDLRDRTGCAILLITHDLGVVAQWCDDATVMYAGRVVEQGPVGELLRRPVHPYTESLLASVPTPGSREPLTPIPGQPPDLAAIPEAGCPFRDRCPLATGRCAEAMPPLDGPGDHRAACWEREVPS
jgi:oligopeptide transport system ATP-binding protein